MSVPGGRFVPLKDAFHVKETAPAPGFVIENTADCSNWPEYHVKQLGEAPPAGTELKQSVNELSPRILVIGTTLIVFGLLPSNGVPDSGDGENATC